MDKRLNAICGDVIEELCKLENDSVDLIVTDPPYNLNKDYGTSQDKTYKLYPMRNRIP